MIVRDKLGWPVELIEGHPVKNFIRVLIHINLRRTWRDRNRPKSKLVTRTFSSDAMQMVDTTPKKNQAL